MWIQNLPDSTTLSLHQFTVIEFIGHQNTELSWRITSYKKMKLYQFLLVYSLCHIFSWSSVQIAILIGLRGLRALQIQNAIFDMIWFTYSRRIHHCVAGLVFIDGLFGKVRAPRRSHSCLFCWQIVAVLVLASLHHLLLDAVLVVESVLRFEAQLPV